MSVQRWELGNGDRRQAPVPGGPSVEIVIGADAGRPVGLLLVTVPAGGAAGSRARRLGDDGDPAVGRLRLVDADDGTVVELEPGVLVTIPIGQRVRLENPAEEEAQALVVLTPPDFAAQLSDWPVP